MTSKEVISYLPNKYNKLTGKRSNMSQRNPSLKLTLIVILMLFTLVGMFFGNLAFVRADHGGLDLFAHWQGARALIYDGINPYTEPAVELIESGLRELAQDSGGDYRFVYPLFSLIFLAPVSLVSEFIIARAIWMTILEAMALLSGYLIAGWMSRKRTLWLTLFVMLALFFNFVVLSTIENGSLTMIGLTAIMGAIHFLVERKDESAGLVLAISLVKPDLALPVLAILVIWIFVNRRFTVLVWLLGSLALLIGFTMVFIPSWPLNYLSSVIEYSARNPVRVETWLPTALETRLLIIKNLAIALVVIFEWFVIKNNGSRRLLWLWGLLFAVLPWIGGQTVLEHTVTIYAAMLIGLGFLFGNRRRGLSFGFALFTLLFTASGWVFSGTLIPGISEQWQSAWLQFVLPLAALGTLYWSRWWVIRQEKFSEDHFSLM